MKNLILIAALFLAASITFGQTLQKGNLVGMHALTVDLDPDATMNQYKSFFINKVIPEYEKHFQGAKLYMVKGLRGENKNGFGLIWLFESEKHRDKFFNDDGSFNEIGTSALEKMNLIDAELEKLGTWTSKYTDWVIQ